MKCPHCNYENGWNGNSLSVINGKHGEFYKMQIKMQREVDFVPETKELYGCPSCNKTFMGE